MWLQEFLNDLDICVLSTGILIYLYVKAVKRQENFENISIGTWIDL